MKKRNKVIIVCIIALFAVCMIAFGALKLLRGHGYFSAAKNYIHYYLNKPDFSTFEPLSEDNNAWYQENRVIAHALGGIEGTEYTNSKEALYAATRQGYQVFEVDFCVTADGKVVCTHDFNEFEEIPDYDTFMNRKVKGKYTPMDLDTLIEYFSSHQDLYLMTDFKWDNSFGSRNHDVEIIMDALTDMIGKYDNDLLKRVIIQVYSEENYLYISENYPYENYVYTLYNFAYPIYDEVAAACLKYRIPVVTMSKDRATKEHVDILQKWNIKVFSHTVNDKEEAVQQLRQGVTGIYTDWILPTEME